jgi:mannosyltransferase OCH1-like enzyme
MESSFLPNTTPSIPNVLHITWLQEEREMPDYIRFNLSTWIRNNPDMKIIIHDDESIRALLAE